MQTKTFLAAIMAEAKTNLRYTAEELLEYNSNSVPYANFELLPKLWVTIFCWLFCERAVYRDFHFEDASLLCPTTRWFYSCKWKGDFDDLKEHLLEHHEMLRLKNSIIIVTKTMFFYINRGFILSDDREEYNYFANVAYHVDKTLYVNVMSLKNRFEIRKYRVSAMGRYHIGEVGGAYYVKIHGLREYFTENESLYIFIEFL